VREGVYTRPKLKLRLFPAPDRPFKIVVTEKFCLVFGHQILF